jgi:hypothetical protein
MQEKYFDHANLKNLPNVVAIPVKHVTVVVSERSIVFSRHGKSSSELVQ